jgi:thiosulfate reductase cytochrome b subunit
MISNATKRTILRSIHLIVSIPILGYIYEPASEVQEYAGGVRYLFVPVMILSGYWMYAGVIFAVIGVAAWIGAYYLAGYGAALLSQVALFIARKIWLVIRARSSKQQNSTLHTTQP